jgi:hypothetical protein
MPEACETLDEIKVNVLIRKKKKVVHIQNVSYIGFCFVPLITFNFCLQFSSEFTGNLLR